MKLIENIDLSLSYNKGRKDLLYGIDEILHLWTPVTGMLKALNDSKKDSNVIGYVKAYTFDVEENDFDFLMIYKNELNCGDLNILKEDLKHYRGYLLDCPSEHEFRQNMLNVDAGKVFDFLKFEDF